MSRGGKKSLIHRITQTSGSYSEKMRLRRQSLLACRHSSCLPNFACHEYQELRTLVIFHSRDANLMLYGLNRSDLWANSQVIKGTWDAPQPSLINRNRRQGSLNLNRSAFPGAQTRGMPRKSEFTTSYHVLVHLSSLSTLPVSVTLYFCPFCDVPPHCWPFAASSHCLNVKFANSRDRSHDNKRIPLNHS